MKRLACSWLRMTYPPITDIPPLPRRPALAWQPIELFRAPVIVGFQIACRHDCWNDSEYQWQRGHCYEERVHLAVLRRAADAWVNAEGRKRGG